MGKSTKQKIVVGTTVVGKSNVQTLNEKDEAQIFKPFKRTGTEGSSILIGLYYKGASELTKLKGYSSPQNTFNAAQRLILKGLLGKNGHVYFLTDKGRDLVAPFIEYARNTQPAY